MIFPTDAEALDAAHRAYTAYEAALRQDWPTAAHAVETLNTRHGTAAVAIAITGWIDIALTALGHDPTSGPATVALQWFDPDTGDLHDATSSDVDPAQVWGGRIMAAYIAHDTGTFQDLINSLAALSPHQAGRNIMHLLDNTADPVRRLMPEGKP